MAVAKLKPDDLCGCNSGRRYADCHGPIFDAPAAKAIPLAQTIYAEEWGVNAEHYRGQGLYTVLAEELVAAGNIRRVLDVGCGLGQGLEALAAVLPKSECRLIVGVDENPACLKGSAERLNIPPSAAELERITPKKRLSGYFESKVMTAPLKLEGEIVLINADLMVDDVAFERWLDGIGPLDAITLWFSGVHKARSLTKVSRRIGAKNDADLREALEDQVMEVAVKRLRPRGVVQIVQRGAGDMETERQNWEEGVASALDEWPFDLMSVVGHSYEEPQNANAITLNSSTFDYSGLPRFALSTLLRRRDDG